MANIERENKRLLDIVDENDNIIGTESRIKVHQLGLLHREVHVWMFSGDKGIIFQRRCLHRPSAGLLDATAGGHINKGEDYLKAAIRETKEETGLSISAADLIFLKKFKGTSSQSGDSLGGTINHFIRAVYLYKNPVDESSIKKETGIPGGGFQKLSYDFLANLNELKRDSLEMFDKLIIPEEIAHVLKYIK